jgi:hypothetical protein
MLTRVAFLTPALVVGAAVHAALPLLETNAGPLESVKASEARDLDLHFFDLLSVHCAWIIQVQLDEHHGTSGVT